MRIPIGKKQRKKADAFLHTFSDKLSEQMSVPDEFTKFFEWAEVNDCFGTSESGEPFIVVDPLVLGPQYISSIMIGTPYENPWWLGSENPDHNSRLKVFATTGGDGSSAAFWLDDAGKQHIVHLDSGSGSVMIGKWVNTPLDFLRLLAIGYGELCWFEDYNRLPSELLDPEEEFYPPKRLRDWILKEFGATIPNTASEIVNQMSEIGAASEDPFCKWIGSITAT